MKEKVNQLKEQPCCGYFLQGGVRTVAVLDTGISLFSIILVGSDFVKKLDELMRMKREGALVLFYVRACLWASFFGVQIAIIGLSIFLFKTARRRNARLCALWIGVSIAVNVYLVLASIVGQIMFSVSPLIWVFFVFYLSYKMYCVHVVYTFIREIRSYGGFNACLRGLTDAEIEEFETGNPPEVCEMKDQLQIVKKQAFNKDFEVPIEILEIDENTPLGSGAFGTVYRAKLLDTQKVMSCSSSQPPTHQTVAVKTVNPTADPTYFKTLLGELKIMTFLPPHENVINLIGACTSQIKNKRLYMVLEFCPFGNLYDHLRARRGLFVNYVKNGEIIPAVSAGEDPSMYRNVGSNNTVNTFNLLQWVYETAKGMEFLEDKKVIHGDLAARNLLLGYGRTIKITDFGLSKKLYQYTCITKQDKLLPWRWMAIESLRDMTFSIKSDVWSYGVILWEIFSLSEIPFPGFSWNADFLQQLLQGLRMQQPPNAPNSMYELMLRTWSHEEDDRPTFTEIRYFFEAELPSYLTLKQKKGLSNEDDSAEEEEQGRTDHVPCKVEGTEEVEVYISNIVEEEKVDSVDSGIVVTSPSSTNSAESSKELNR